MSDYDPMLNEAREYLADGRVRPDHYRGLTKAQVIGIYGENESVEKYRKEVNDSQFDEGAQFRAESDHVNVLVAAAEYHAQNEKLRERLDVQEHLQKMMIEERERKAKAEEYARNIDDLVAQKDYTSAAALQALMDTPRPMVRVGTSGQAQEEHTTITPHPSATGHRS